MWTLREAAKPKRAESGDILSHWLMVLPILLAVAALGSRQIDLYPPSTDEFWAMNDAGWVAGGPYSPAEIIQSLRLYSANHTPGYFFLMSAWGSLVGHEVAMGRALALLLGLLALAAIYRLSRDFVAPAAGLFALAVVVCNAYNNNFIAYARMYTLLVALAALTLWLYLRIMERPLPGRRRDCVALALASYALANTHAFSALFFIMLGLHHLLFAPKNRKWLEVALAVIIAMLLFSPWILVLATGGLERTYFWSSVTLWDILGDWLVVSLNGSLPLALIAGLGLVFGIRAGSIKCAPFHWLVLLLALALGIFALAPRALDLLAARYLQWGLAPISLFAGAGLYSIYRYRRWLGLLCLLPWLLTGLDFQLADAWARTRVGNEEVLGRPPWQALSRFVINENLPYPMLAHRLDGEVLDAPDNIIYTESEYYFGRHGISFEPHAFPRTLRRRVSLNAITQPSFWLVYQTGVTSANEFAELEEFLNAANYQACAAHEFGLDTRLLLFTWTTLNCAQPALLGGGRNDMLMLEFYGASLQAARKRLLFVDKWTAARDFEHERYKMSYQLINDSWSNVAQVDLALAHEGELRQFSIDIGSLAAGSYRLMAIVYERHSGETTEWHNNPGYTPVMLELTALNLP